MTSGAIVYSSITAGRCCLVGSGYVKIVDPRLDGSRTVRLIVGQGGLFGDRPFGHEAFGGFASPQPEMAIAHGPADVLEFDREDLESACRRDVDLAELLLGAMAARAQFLERRLLWQFTTPIRCRVAATLRDLICFEGRRCTHGHTIDVRLSHSDLSELVGAARPVVSSEVVRMRREGLLEYTRCFFCVDDLGGLDRIANQSHFEAGA